MRWIPYLSTALVVVVALATTAEVAGALPPFEPTETVADGNCAAPAHPLGLRASFAGDAPWGPPPGPERGMEAPLPPFLQGLTLSDEQQDRIFDLLHGQAPQVRQWMRSLQKSHARLREMGLSDTYDEAQARVLVDAQARTLGELALLHARTDHGILALLTPEQRQRVTADLRNSGDRVRPGAERGPACWH